MTTIISIENAAGSGQLIKVVQDFGREGGHRLLSPGQSVRLPLSQFKSVVILQADSDEILQDAAKKRPFC